jgi:hypothetical protein
MNLGPQGEIRSGLAILFDAHVADPYAPDGPGLIEQGLGRSKSREHIHPQLLRLRPKDGNQLSERHDEVAVIRHLRWGRQAIALAAGHQ